MTPIEAFRAAFAASDFAPLAGLLLHRATMEDGLALHVGRDAVVGALIGDAALFAGRQAEVRGVGDVLAVTLTGELAEPFRGAEAGRAVELRRHLWLEMEGARILRVTAVTDWIGFARTLGIGWDDWARELGAAHPAHRPLGELRSGRGQYWPEPGGDAIADMVNRRSFPTPPGVTNLYALTWLPVLRRMPDAVLTPDRAVGGLALHRLQGHVGGRRVSLPVSTLNGLQLVDLLALEAHAHRPFLGEAL